MVGSPGGLQISVIARFRSTPQRVRRAISTTQESTREVGTQRVIDRVSERSKDDGQLSVAAQIELALSKLVATDRVPVALAQAASVVLSDLRKKSELSPDYAMHQLRNFFDLLAGEPRPSVLTAVSLLAALMYLAQPEILRTVHAMKDVCSQWP